MNYLTMDEKLLLFKIVLAYFEGNKTFNVSDIEIDTALTILYENTDNQLYWTTQQKENFKNWVGFCKFMHQMLPRDKMIPYTI